MSNHDHPFNQAINLTLESEGSWRGHTHPAYSSMVGPFGGITSAVLLNAILKDPRRPSGLGGTTSARSEV